MHRADKNKFAVLRGARRVWAVAAIHGEADRLKRLHEAIGERHLPGDRVVYLGNYLGYGPAIVGVLDELLGFRRALLALPGAMKCDIAYLRGSQEEMWHKLLQLHLAVNPGEVLEWMLARGARETLEAYGSGPEAARIRTRGGARELARWTSELRDAMARHPGHVELLTSLQRAAFTEDSALLFVSAGLDLGRPLEAQSDNLWWGGGDFDTLTEPYAGYRLVVRGHDRTRRGMRAGPVSVTLDGGCGFGGPLHGACFEPSGRMVELLEA